MTVGVWLPFFPFAPLFAEAPLFCRGGSIARLSRLWEVIVGSAGATRYDLLYPFAAWFRSKLHVVRRKPSWVVGLSHFDMTGGRYEAFRFVCDRLDVVNRL